MHSYNVLSPGKKIKEIRKKLGLKQFEITGGEITRNLISIIENDKTSLTPHVAEIIANTINKICETRKVDFHVNPSYLLEDEQAQVSQISERYMSFLIECEKGANRDISDELEDIENFIVVWGAGEKKADIYKKIGDIFKKQGDLYKSYTYYIKAFESSNKLTNDIKLSELLLQIGYCCIRLKRYNEALSFNKLAFKYNDLMPKQLQFKFLFNDVLAYKKLNLYNKALDEIDYIHSNFDNIGMEDKFDLLTLKANCLTGNKYYKDSLELQKYLLSVLDEDSIDKRLLIMCNILDIYLILKDSKNIRLYADKAVLIINSYKDFIRSSYSPESYNQIGMAFYFIAQVDISKEYFSKAAYAAKLHKTYDILLNALDSLFLIYVNEGSPNDLEGVKNQLLEAISLGIVPYSNRLIFRFINYYNDNNDQESIKSLMNFILDDSNNYIK